MTGQNWTCPYCDKSQISTPENRDKTESILRVGHLQSDRIGSKLTAVRCLNPECGQTTVYLWVGAWLLGQYVDKPDDSAPPLFKRRVLPEGGAKAVPDYVPEAIRADYLEACLIRELSPKASATLSRRCLQGMIRHFAKISVKSKKLVDEITALEKSVEDGSAPRGVSIDSIEAITAVRKIGNIGAHMEADIDLIVDVDPGEARRLTDLIEMLIDDWYIEAHKRASRFAGVVAVAEGKVQMLAAAKAAKALPAPEPSGTVDE